MTRGKDFTYGNFLSLDCRTVGYSHESLSSTPTTFSPSSSPATSPLLPKQNSSSSDSPALKQKNRVPIASRDSAYKERRRKNNEAARRSRQKKKNQEQVTREMLILSQQQNADLLKENEELSTKVRNLQMILRSLTHYSDFSGVHICR